ncbi:Uncharacterised protein [Mycobacteroides abscessus subsp. abscessus]|nr:Uncharacterised protein [Mycobacteroides abscessus subsp. abscessus]SKD11163.1 Uncharacterised protein [Mycobacteroides abscessus subsp. abscessus]SKL37582.1 Uncharacterised protein [Mycobacteroides abscessus subsp. abscessus]SKM28101.1 Uncharacterised protein [Mycobacteroides abscessus subsp. abscessus]
MRWTLIGITIGIAAASTAVRIFLTDICRPTDAKRRFSLTREDFVFWVDWAILGALGFMLSLIGASNSHTQLSVGTALGGLALVLIATVIIPWVVRTFAYDTHDKLRPSVIVVADTLGALVLATAVQLGITVYDWTGNASS